MVALTNEHSCAQETEKSEPEKELSRDNLFEVVQTLATTIENKYVLETEAKRISAKLMQRAREGKFDQVKSNEELATTLTRSLIEISQDRHFAVTYAPDYEAPKEDLPDPEAGKLHNFGIREEKRIDGNIGYLRFSGFHDPTVGFEPFVAAIQLLKNADAIILDLRENGGGSESMATIVSSCFVPPGKTQFSSMVTRGNGSTRQRWNTPYLEQRLDEQPLFILTSQATFSAAEAVAYDLQSLKRAVIVGERTGGGAHKIEFPALVKGFRMQLPIEKAVNPITRSNWEKVGVTPDIECTESDSFHRAIVEIADKLGKTEKDKTIQQELIWVRQFSSAMLDPQGISDIEKGKLVGTYGIEKIELINNQLWCHRKNYSRWRMEYLGNGLFHFPDVSNYRIKFEHDSDGNPIRLLGLYRSGAEVKRDREK